MDGVEGVDGIEGIESIFGVDGVLGVDGVEGVDGIEGIEGLDDTPEIDGDFTGEEPLEGLREGTLLRAIVAPNILPIAPLLALAALIAVEPADSLHSALYFPTSKVDVG